MVRRPTATEFNGRTNILYAKDARLHNITNAAHIIVKCKVTVFIYPNELKVPLDVIRHSATIIRQHEETFTFWEILALAGSMIDNQFSDACFDLRQLPCPLDPRGYAIINGTEYNISYTVRDRFNVPTFHDTKKRKLCFSVEYRSGFFAQYKSSATLFIEVVVNSLLKHMHAQARFNKENKANTTSNTITVLPMDTLLCACGIPREVIPDLFRQLSRRWTSTHQEVLKRMIEKDSTSPQTTKDALVLIGKKLALDRFLPEEELIFNAKRYLNKTLFVNTFHAANDHVGRKAILLLSLLGELCERIFIHTNAKESESHPSHNPWTSRDSNLNKCLDAPGQNFGNLGRQMITRITFHKLARQYRTRLHKLIGPIQLGASVAKTKLSQSFNERVTSSSFSAVKNPQANRSGWTQVISRTNVIEPLSTDMRKQLRLQNENTQTSPRLNNDYFGTTCPSATPDGSKCGTVNETTLMVVLSTAHSPDALLMWLGHFGVIMFAPSIEPFFSWDERGERSYTQFHPDQDHLVFVNGSPVGFWPGERLCTQALDHIHDAMNVWSILQGSTSKEAFPPRGRSAQGAYVLIEAFLSLRRRLLIGFDVNWALDLKHPFFGESTNLRDPELVDRIHFFTDESRELRPLLVTENMHLLKGVDLKTVSWHAMLRSGVIEYVDRREEVHCYVAMFPDQVTEKHSHCEIHPALSMWGVSMNILPLPQYNYGTKTMHQAMMIRSALGRATTLPATRRDISSTIPWYPERPLIRSEIYSMLRLSALPIGCHVSIMICPFFSSNGEDGIICGQGPVDRGWRSGISIRSIVARQKRGGPSVVLTTGSTVDEPSDAVFGTIKLDKPNQDQIGRVAEGSCLGRKRGDYSKCDEDGIIGIGHLALPGDVVVQRSVKLDERRSVPYVKNNLQGSGKRETLHRRDTSMLMDRTEKGEVHSVIAIASSEFDQYVIQTSNPLKPKTGDKFTTGAGQKGAILVVPESEIPVSNDRHFLRPTLIVNPPGQYARMTPGQQLEGLLQALATAFGEELDSTCWNEHRNRIFHEYIQGLNPQDVDLSVMMQDMLFQLGFTKDLSRSWIDSRTGEVIQEPLVFFTNYVMQLKQRPENKIRGRGIGKKDGHSKQPVAKRKHGGGLRLGEQEALVISSHGASEVLKDITYRSDASFIYVCPKCDSPRAVEMSTGYVVCPSCGSVNDARHAIVPYASVYLFTLLTSLGLGVKMKTAPQAPRPQLK